MDRDIDSPDPFEDNYEYSHMGRNFGHPAANMLMHGLFGKNLMPQPRDGQDMYDALIQRERSQHFMNLQSSSFSNNMLNQSLGISGPAAAIVGRMAGSPEGGLARMMSPMLGGNPMAASMQTYAGLSGASTMGAFGRSHSVSEEESQGVMNSLANNFYKTQRFEGKGGIAEELQESNSKFLNSLVDKNDKASVKHLKDSGIQFEETKEGKIKDPEGLKKQISGMDVTSGFQAGKAEEIQKAQITAGLGRDMSRMLSETDAEVKKALEERMEKIFKATGTTVSNEVKSAPSREESSAARKDLASNIFKALDELDVAPQEEEQKKTAKIKQQFRDLGVSETSLASLDGAEGELSRAAAQQLASDLVSGKEAISPEAQDKLQNESFSAFKTSRESALTRLQSGVTEALGITGEEFEKQYIDRDTSPANYDGKLLQTGKLQRSFEAANKVGELQALETDIAAANADYSDDTSTRLASSVSKVMGDVNAPPTSKEDKQKKAEQVKQQFRDLGMSERMVQKLEKPDGDIDKDAARKMASDFAEGKTDFLDKESKESTQARDNIAVKRMRRQSMLENLDKATETYVEDGDTSKEGKQKNKEKKEAFTARKQAAGGELQAQAISQLGITQSEFESKYMGKEHIWSDKVLLKDKLQKDIEKSTELSVPEKSRLEADQFGAAGFKRKGINFENTRGFKIEDFTSGFAKAAELRMLGDSRGKSPEEMMDKFSKNAGGVMAASRSLFGNKSGGELMQKASDLMGVTSVDMSSASGAKEVEDMLRKVKSTARVAGLSVKHMMGIIEATRDMARSNPQLQQMNQGSITNLAVASSMRAAAAGTQMSSEDFRNAGGGQGVMAGETKSSLTFAQSGMGRLQAVAMAQAISRGKGDEMEKLIKEGKFTPEALAKGGYAEIAKVAGVSTGSLSYMAGDPETAARAMKIKRVSDTVTGEGADQAVIGETTRMVSRGIFRKSGKEKDLQKLYAEEKAKGMTDEEFESKHIDPNLTTMQREMFQAHKTKFFRGLRESNMSAPVRDSLTKIRDADMKASADTSKRLEGKTGSIASQAISAFMNNEGMDNISEALVGIFATSDKSPNKGLMEKAQKSAKGLYDSIRDKGKGSDKERMDRIDVKAAGEDKSDLDRINDVISAQKAQAVETGDKERAGQLQNITKQDVKDLQLASGVTNVEEAKTRLKELRTRETNKEKLTPVMLKQKKALEAREKLGGFASQESFESINKATVAGIAGGLLAGGKASAEKTGLEERKTAMYKTMDEQLAELSKKETEDPTLLKKGDPSIKAATDYYKDKGGAKQLSEDLQKGKGFFANAETKDKYAKGSLGSIVSTTASAIATEETNAKGSASAAPAADAAFAGIKTALDSILTAITGQDSVKSAITTLADAIKSF